jgi:hypothetical protein
MHDHGGILGTHYVKCMFIEFVYRIDQIIDNIVCIILLIGVGSSTPKDKLFLPAFFCSRHC